MEPVLKAQPAVTGVELQMVEVVEFWRKAHGEMVSRVVIHYLQTKNGQMVISIEINQLKLTSTYKTKAT